MENRSQFDAIMASGRLPSPGGIALRVIQLIDKDDATNQNVAHAIKSDPALSSRIIKVANAKVAYQTRPIVSVLDAVTVLGFNEVRQLVLSLSLLENRAGETCAEFDYQNFWSRSLLTAITAQNLVLQSGIGSPEEVFILGLLGQIGRLALATVHPEAYSAILRAAGTDKSLAELETAEFGFDHNQLTQAMLESWGLPKAFQEVALHHETPELASFAEGSRNWRLLNVLHVSDYFSSLCLSCGSGRRKMVPRLIMMAARLGVELDALAVLCDKSVREWQDWSLLCDIRSVEVPLFAEIFEAVPLVPSMLEMQDEVSPGAASFYRMRILIVEDDRAAKLLLKTLLEKIGHTVATASDGQEALGMIETFMPQLIITDWLMPVMDGIEFCKSLRRNTAWRNIYVFILTAQEGVDSLVEAFEAGANDYMTKPVSPKVLMARLRAGQRVVQLQEEMEFDRQQLHQFADELASFNQRLRKNDVSMRAILDNSPYMAWLKDADGRYVKVNRTFVEYVGQKDDQQVIGKTDFDLWPEELARKYSAIDAEVIATRRQLRTEEALPGVSRWLETIKTPVIDENGNVLGTTGYARDITEQVDREALRLTEVRKQRDVLVREVHHRIKNNLQGVVGLLRQHVITHPELSEVVQVIIGRIYSIAIIHGLQAKTLTEEVNLDELMKSIVDATGVRADYRSELAGPVYLSKEETVPIALVLNELYTNACKHRTADSFPAIRLKMRGSDTIVLIANRYTPKEAEGDGQGLNLVQSLLPENATKLTVVCNGGIYTVELKLSPPVTMLR